MLNFKRQETWNRAFTLIELVIGIGLTGLLLLVSFSIFSFTSKVASDVQTEDDFLLQGRFAIEYVREDITEATEIVSMEEYLPDNFLYTDTLDFFIVKEEIDFNHIFYKLDGEILTRISFKTSEKLPKNMPNMRGNNPILEDVCKISESYYDEENEILCLVIRTKNKLNSKEYCFMETLYLKDDIN